MGQVLEEENIAFIVEEGDEQKWACKRRWAPLSREEPLGTSTCMSNTSTATSSSSTGHPTVQMLSKLTHASSISILCLQLTQSSLEFRDSIQTKMAAMATLNAASIAMQSVSLSSSTVRVGAGSSLRLTSRAPVSRRAHVLQVRAAGNPERIDNFVEGAKSDASKNAQGFGDAVKQKAGEVGDTVKDVGRDMGAKAQEAADAGSRKVDEAGGKTREVGDEVKGSTKDTLDSATDTRDGQSVVEKASNAASNVGQNLKQNFDQGTAAAKNAADDATKDAKKTTDGL